MEKRHVAGYIVTGVASLAVGLAIGGVGSTEASPKPSPTVTKTVAAPSPTPSARAASETAPKGDWSPQEWASEFKKFTAKEGTDQQKTAVRHVTKIKGFEGNTDDWVAQDVKIFTDFQGEEYDHNPEAELIIDALTDWQGSEEGDVYVEVFAGNGNGQGSGSL